MQSVHHLERIVGTPKILVVDDDPDILFLLKRLLTAEGYYVLVSEDGEKGLSIAQSEKPNLVILDIMLPNASGLDICRELRKLDGEIYIFMLTALDDDLDKIRGLDMGADDYLTKPFNPLELSARVKSVFRRMNLPEKREVIRFGSVAVNLVNREVFLNGEKLEFTQREFDLLGYLVQRPGEAISREVLFEEIWGLSSETGMRNIDNFILRIRKKLEPDPAEPVHFLTVYGYGYRFMSGESGAVSTA